MGFVVGEVLIQGPSGNLVDVSTDGLEVEIKKSVLPDGASTSANQATTNTNLTNIYTRQSDRTQLTKITDGNNDASVDASGNLKVVNPTPAPPEGTTAIEESTQGNVSASGGTAGINYVIPDGETAQLQSFEFAGYCTSDIIAKAELYWQPNGNATGEVLITALYLQGQSSCSTNLLEDTEYLGDGTARFRTVFTNQSASIAELYYKLLGYY